MDSNSTDIARTRNPRVEGLCPLIQVYDMLESIGFYCDRLGFAIDRQSPLVQEPYEHFSWALLKRDGVELMLNTAYDADRRPSSKDAGRMRAHQDTILYFYCPDVDGMYEIVRANGLDVDAPAVSHGMKGFQFSDPDGYEICFHWPASE